jgi:acylglycerol lipase
MPTGPITQTDLVLPVADGLKLAGRSWLPSGTPRGSVVVVHGLKDHGARYEYLAAALQDRGFAIYAFDLRGHGRSEGPRAWVPRFEEYLEDLDRVLAEVRRRQPTGPLFLFGHSMGGAIVTLYAIDHRPMIAGVVLSAPALRRPASVSSGTAAFTKFLSVVAPHLGVFRLPNGQFSRDPSVVAAMASDPLIYQPPAPARTAGELLKAIDRIRRRAPEFTVPLLALHGSADLLTHPEGSRALVANARSTDKALRIFPNLYHDLLHEPEREKVRMEIVGWLKIRAKREPE